MPLQLNDIEAAYQRTQPALQRVTLEEGWRLPQLSVERLSKPLQLELGVVEARLEQATALMGEEDHAAFVTLLEGVWDALGATLWAEALHKRQTTAPSEVTQALQRCRSFQQLGFHWLEPLRFFGLLSAAEVAQLRAGRSNTDAIGDVAVMASLFERSWSRLEPMQPMQQDASLRLSPELIAEMKATADLLRRAEQLQRPSEGAPDWRTELRRAYTLLETRWDRLRYTAVGGYAWSERLDWAAKGHPSIYKLDRSV